MMKTKRTFAFEIRGSYAETMLHDPANAVIIKCLAGDSHEIHKALAEKIKIFLESESKEVQETQEEELIENVLDRLDTLYLMDFNKGMITMSELQKATRSLITQLITIHRKQ